MDDLNPTLPADAGAPVPCVEAIAVPFVEAEVAPAVEARPRRGRTQETHPMSTDPLASDRAAIVRMEAQRAAYPAEALRLTEAGDVDGLLHLQQQYEQLPARIAAIRLRVLTAQIAQAEQQQATAVLSAPGAESDLEAAKAALDTAQARYNAALAVYRNHQQARDDSRLRLAELRRERARLLAEQTAPPLRVVRIAPSALGGRP